MRGWVFTTLVLACGPAQSAPAERPIELPALVDLVPAAGLDMLVDLRPRELYARPGLRPILATAIPDIQLETFARRHGGVDPRELEQIVIATYGNGIVMGAAPPNPQRGRLPAGAGSLLALGLGDFSPAALEQAFRDRATRVTLRAVDRPGGPLSAIVRLEGTEASSDGWEPSSAGVWGRSPRHESTEPLVLAMFGRRAAVVETNAQSDGLLRATELFAMNRLARARPALRAPPLDTAATAMGAAPVRVFFPGPFEGDTAKGLAGLLAGATAVAIVAHPSADAPKPAFDVVVALFGAWGDDAPKAGQRFAAAVENITRSDLGRLLGLADPIRGPNLAVSPTMLAVSAQLDAAALASGARAATGGQIQEIMGE